MAKLCLLNCRAECVWIKGGILPSSQHDSFPDLPAASAWTRLKPEVLRRTHYVLPAATGSLELTSEQSIHGAPFVQPASWL